MKKTFSFILTILLASAALLPAAKAAPATGAGYTVTGYAVPVESGRGRAALCAGTEAHAQEEALELILAMKEKYPEGMKWDNSDYYAWNGGYYSGGYGCAGFALLLSDAAFGDLPCRIKYEFSYESLRTGDILRVNNDSHSVVILEVYADSVKIAEGNYNRSIHWGRILSKGSVMAADYVITRYPPVICTQGEFTAEIDVDSATIVGWSGESSNYDPAEVTIPDTVGGYPVRAVGDEVFARKYLRSVHFPEGLEEIGAYAFYGCSLAEAAFPEGLKRIGYSAFFGSGLTGEVFIPASVVIIDTYAFSYCRSITAFSVSEDSMAYCSVDGALLEKDCKTLLNYPLNSEAEEYAAPYTVELLYCTSFAQAKNLKRVYIYSPEVRAMTYTFAYDNFELWCRKGTQLYKQLEDGRLDTDVTLYALASWQTEAGKERITVTITDDFSYGYSFLAAYSESGRLLGTAELSGRETCTAELPGTSLTAEIRLFKMDEECCPARVTEQIWTRGG
ncbi:MAG: leucine-rich repeat domain-containing protein [Oscillospiraceae bacterium]|nr:leucine-rich repeat domain-containing protein [Oscillospiraceae bacterium]